MKYTYIEVKSLYNHNIKYRMDVSGLHKNHTKQLEIEIDKTLDIEYYAIINSYDKQQLLIP